MDEINPQPVQELKKKRFLVTFAVVAFIGLLAAAALTWLYHPYFKAQRAEQEGEERRAILNTLPENPRAKDLTFEERQILLSDLETGQVFPQ